MQGILSTYGAWNRWKGNLLGFHLSLVLKLSDKHRRSSHDFFKPEFFFFCLYAFFYPCAMKEHQGDKTQQLTTTILKAL